MFKRIYRQRKRILICAALFSILVFIQLLVVSKTEEIFFTGSHFDVISGFVVFIVISIASILIGFILALLLTTFLQSFVWITIWFAAFVIPLNILVILQPNLFSFLGDYMALVLWLVMMTAVILFNKLILSQRINTQFTKEYYAQTSFDVDLTPAQIWGKLCPLPENLPTLFSESISGIEPLDPNRHHYKIYTNNAGQQKPDELVFTKLDEYSGFNTQSIHTDRYGNACKIQEIYDFKENEENTTVFISEERNNMPLVDWLWNKYFDRHGDYWDGFEAHCNGKRDFSISGAGRKKTSP